MLCINNGPATSKLLLPFAEKVLRAMPIFSKGECDTLWEEKDNLKPYMEKYSLFCIFGWFDFSGETTTHRHEVRLENVFDKRSSYLNLISVNDGVNVCVAFLERKSMKIFECGVVGAVFKS